MQKALSLLFMMISLSTITTTAQPPQAAGGATRQHHLMPVPASLEFTDGKLALNESFTIAVTKHNDERLLSAIHRMARRLEGRTGLTFARALASDANAAKLLIECQSAGKDIPALDEDESYALTIDAGRAMLSAPTVVGAMRGLETLLQLLDGDRDGYFFPAIKIQDRPRFPWRGLLIDVCRHWQPIEVLKRNLDGMAAVKLNVLHLHLTEDQGFRVESKKYPKLHRMGSDGLFYTQDQVREVVAYARERGIRVVPEFDMPGHTTSWAVGHPELASAPGPYQIERQWGVMDPTFDPTREEVYKLIDGFLGEMAALFPDAYMHIGGDENNGKQWSKNERIQAFMKAKGIKDNHALQTYFNQRLLQILKAHGKRMVGWDEVLHPDLPRDIVVQSWRGPGSLAEAAKQGYNGILSSGYYLDHILPASRHYAVDPIAANSDLDEQQAARVLGGEACMWSEYVDQETIDSRIWPRLAAIAERLWSPRTVTDVADMYRRLARISMQLEELGLLHEKNAGMMRRRLAGGEDGGWLKTFIDVVEPVKFYNRGQDRPMTQLTPLTRVVDAAQPDSAAGRRWAQLVDELLADAPRLQTSRAAVVEMLTRWRDVYPAFAAMSARAPVLREAAPLAKDLSEASDAGLEAMAYLMKRVAPPAGWREATLARLEQAATPKAAIELVIIPGLRQLVVAAAEVEQLKTTTPVEWVERVKAAAQPPKKTR